MISVVDLAPVSNGNDQYNETVVLDRRDNAIAANAIAPQALQIAGERLTETPWVFCCGNTFAKITNDGSYAYCTELAKIARRFGVEFYSPGAGFAHATSTCLGKFALQFFKCHPRPFAG